MHLCVRERDSTLIHGSSDSSSGNRLSESSCSDSMFGHNGSCSDGGTETPLSDRASLAGTELQNQDAPEKDDGQNLQEMEESLCSSRLKDGCPAAHFGVLFSAVVLTIASFFSSMLLPGLEPDPGKTSGPYADGLPTPDVDLLLDCTFSYMQRSEEEEALEQPVEDKDEEFQSPLTETKQVRLGLLLL